MKFAMLLALTLFVSLTIQRMRYFRRRSTRWKLLALRDELRAQAIADASLNGHEVFESLDGMLTRFAANLDLISIWTVGPAILRSNDSVEHAPKIDERFDAERAYYFYSEIVDSIVWHLWWRHLGLNLLLVCTVVWPVVFFGALKGRILTAFLEIPPALRPTHV